MRNLWLGRAIRVVALSGAAAFILLQGPQVQACNNLICSIDDQGHAYCEMLGPGNGGYDDCLVRMNICTNQFPCID